MTVPVSVWGPNGGSWRFRSISKAADYVLGLAFEKLQRKCSKGFVSRWISDRNRKGNAVYSKLNLLGIRFEFEYEFEMLDDSDEEFRCTDCNNRVTYEDEKCYDCLSGECGVLELEY